MKAEVTAENRPACDPSQFACVQAIRKAHEYQRCVQILVVSPDEFVVVHIRLLKIIPVKGAIVLRSRAHVLPLAVGKVLAIFRVKRSGNLPFSRLTGFYPDLLFRFSPSILAAVKLSQTGYRR